MRVTLLIGGEPFDCLPFSEEVFRGNDAVYAILSIKGGGRWKVVDITDTSKVPKEKEEILKQKKYWEDKCQNRNIWVGAYVMPGDKFNDQDRADFQKLLIERYDL